MYLQRTQAFGDDLGGRAMAFRIPVAIARARPLSAETVSDQACLISLLL
jgi:hypothetical protein